MFSFLRKVIPDSFWDRDYFRYSISGKLIWGIWAKLTSNVRPLSSASPEIQRKARMAMYSSVANMHESSKNNSSFITEKNTQSDENEK